MDNKHNPDFYVVGLIVAFLGIEFICRWYPVLVKKDGRAAFLKGIVDAGEDGFDFMDILGELWRVRRTDPPVFDAALYLKYGEDKARTIINEILSRGKEDFLNRENEKKREMTDYGFIYSRLLKSFNRSNELGYGDSTDPYLDCNNTEQSLLERKSDYSDITEFRPKRYGGTNGIEVYNGIPGISKKCPLCGKLYANSEAGIAEHIRSHIRSGDARKEDEIMLRDKMIGANFDIRIRNKIIRKKELEKPDNAQL